MMRDPRTPIEFRGIYAIAAVVLWTINGLIGVWLNGGFGPLKTVQSALVFSLGGAILLTVMVGPLLSRTLNAMAFKPNADLKNMTSGLIFCGFVGFFLVMGGLWTAFHLAK